MGPNEKPLVTFALIAYNQENFVREAVEGALAQTYSPLQIILSDDCSRDRTFQIMEEMASEYKGSNKIFLNGNKKNLGIGAHVNRIMDYAEGDLIVIAAGDDVSLPSRTAKIFEAWKSSGYQACSICSDMHVVDEHGQLMSYQSGKPFVGSIVDGVCNYFSGLQGASHAWSKRVFDVFGPMLENTVCEDRVIPLRSELLGGTIYLPQPLVRYRVGRNNISHYGNTAPAAVLSKTAEIHARNANIYENYIKDIDQALDLDLGVYEDVVAARTIAEKLFLMQKIKADFALANTLRKISLLLRCIRLSPSQAARFAAILIMPGLYRRNQLKNLGIK